MPYSKVKVYSDGSHPIGIPYEPNPYVRKRRKQPEEVITVTEPAEDVSATTMMLLPGTNLLKRRGRISLPFPNKGK